MISECEKALVGESYNHLTLLQYEQMNPEEMKRLDNRVRQWASKMKQNIPKDHGVFCLVLKHLLRNAHRPYGLSSPSEIQKSVLCDDKVSDEMKQNICEKFKELNRKVRFLGEMRKKNRLVEHRQCADELLREYKTFSNISKLSGISLKTINTWFSTPTPKVHKATELSRLRKEEYERFLQQDTISYPHPCKKHAGKRILRQTIDDLREIYVNQTEFHTYGVVSLSCMKDYRTSKYVLVGHTPLDTCLCPKCQNCEVLLKRFQQLGLKNIPANEYKAVKAVECSERYCQYGSTSTFPKLDCILGKCDKCGLHLLEDLIKSGNEVLFAENKNITWRRWMKKEGKSAPIPVQIRGTIRQSLAYLLDLVKPLRAHLFRSIWNRNVFDYIRKNIVLGFIVQIFDFAMNFKNFFQDAVQSSHWDSTQTAIHAIINYFLCPVAGCKEIVTLTLAQITDDLIHDSFVARAGHDAAFRYLADLGIPMDIIFQFCDNCGAQYKSRRPFAELARSPLEIIRVYFGESHGKSFCDGFFGRLKSWMSRQIISRNAIIENADDFFRYCKEEYETKPAPEGTCQHDRVIFQFLRPSDIRRHQDCTLEKAIPGTMSIYSVRNTPNPLELKVRNIPCLCPPCIQDNGLPCENSLYTDPWRKVQLIPERTLTKGSTQKGSIHRKIFADVSKCKRMKTLMTKTFFPTLSCHQLLKTSRCLTMKTSLI